MEGHSRSKSLLVLEFENQRVLGAIRPEWETVAVSGEIQGGNSESNFLWYQGVLRELWGLWEPCP